jgi:hypothetical protein
MRAHIWKGMRLFLLLELLARFAAAGFFLLLFAAGSDRALGLDLLLSRFRFRFVWHT